MAMVAMRDPSGREFDVDAAEAAEAQANGWKLLDSPGAPGSAPSAAPSAAAVAMRAPDGRVYDVDAGEASEAARNGWQPLSDDETRKFDLEAEYGDRDIAAGAAGFARGLTFGGSDWLLTKTGIVKPETLSGLREANPLVSTGTELVGAVGPAVFTGGATAPASIGLRGALSAAARATPAGLAARAGSAAAGLAKTAVSRTGLGMPVRAAAGRFAAAPMLEKAASKAISTAVGGAVEGAAYGAGQVVSAEALGDPMTAGEKLSAVMMSGLLGGGIGAAAGAFGTIGSATARKLSKPLGISNESIAARVREMADVRAIKSTGGRPGRIAKLELKGDEALGDAAEFMRSYQLKSGPEAGSKILGPFATREGMLTRAEQAFEETGAGIGAAAQRVDEVAGTAIFDPRKFAVKAQKEIANPLYDLGPGARHDVTLIEEEIQSIFEAAGDRPISIFEAIQWRKGFDKRGLKYGIEQPQLKEQMKRLRGLFNEEIRATVRKIGDEAKQPKLIDEFVSAHKAYGAAAEVRRLAEDGVLALHGNRTVSITDTMFSAGGLGAYGLEGLLAGAVSRLGRTRGSQFAAVTLDRAARLLERQSDSIASAAKAFATARAQTVRLAERSAIETLDSVQFGQHAYAAAPKDEREAFERRAAELTQLTKNPALLEQSLVQQTAGVEQFAPDVAAATRMQTQRAAAFLESKLPRPPEPKTPSPVLAAPRRVSDPEIARWSRYLEAVTDPMGVIERLASGHVSAEAAEALRAVYPGLHAEAGTKIIEALNESGERPDYQTRLRLSRFLGVPVDPTQTTEFANFMARVRERSRAETAAEQGTPAINADIKLGLSEQTDTTFARIAGGL